MNLMHEQLAPLGFNPARVAKSTWSVKPWTPGEFGKLTTEVEHG